MMLPCLCGYYEYDVMMLRSYEILLWLCDFNVVVIMEFISFIMTVKIYWSPDEIWYVWCGTWISTHDMNDLMMLCDEMNECWWYGSVVDKKEIFVRNVWFQNTNIQDTEAMRWMDTWYDMKNKCVLSNKP